MMHARWPVTVLWILPERWISAEYAGVVALLQVALSVSVMLAMLYSVLAEPLLQK
jgi:hypothetical protein